MPTGEIIGFLLGPFWQIILHEQFPENFAMSPLPLLIYLPLWGMGLWMSKIAFDTGRLQNLTRTEYAMKIGKVWFLHLLILLFFGTFMISGYPPPTQIPLPIVGIVSLLLTNLIVKKQDDVWEDGDVTQ
ncbi:MAG: hypothetical protein ACTSUO_04670 [Candidatus Thorarchaeota archaeon]